MSISWINAAALAGLALIAVPIAIHLLVRQQTRVLAYPSLRFLRETSLAAFRRRAIQDAALLACRIGIIAAGVTALAGPILHTSSRSGGYASRVSRAVIAVDDAAVEEVEASFRSKRFTRVEVGDAIADAVRWLDAQPPSAREIVFTGSFRLGAIDAGDLAPIPAAIGIRMRAAESTTAPAEISAPLLIRRNGTLVRVDQHVRADADSTRVSPGAATPVSEDRIRVVAAAGDQRLAEAALGAAIDEGIPWTAGERRVLVAWDGADPKSVDAPGVDVIRMPVPDPWNAASATWNAITRATPTGFIEPVLIPREQLTAWSRVPGAPSPDAIPIDEGDRRWLWAAVLAILALEHMLRRERARPLTATARDEEARVA